MTDLHLYLPSPLREDTQAGAVNIVSRIIAATGLRPVFHGDSDAERARAGGDGLHLFHMQEPTGPRVLNLRRAYAYPFWRIETTNERWRFDVAQAAFDPGAVDMVEARPFFRRQQARFLGDGPEPSRDGFIFMPLQGRLRDHRSFQAMSPVEMIEATLEQDPRPIRATLHPREVYDTADRAALDRLKARFPRFKLVQAEAGALLRTCDLVVTQNSSVALAGFFAKKPAVLFAQIDFHHIAGSVPRDGLAGAFARAGVPAPYVEYLYWFFRTDCINGGAPDSAEQILRRMRRHSWAV